MDLGGERDQWSHILLPFRFPAQINFGIAGPEEAKNRAGRGVLRLGSDPLNDGEFGKNLAFLSIKIAAHSNRRFEFHKRRQLFIRTFNERFPLSRCALATKIVPPSESTVETPRQLQPALPSLSAMLSQFFMWRILPVLPSHSNSKMVLS